MGLLSHLMEKPWSEGHGRGTDPHGRGLFSLQPAQVGLRVFLIVASFLFLLFTAAYVDRMMSIHGHGAGHGDWRAVAEPPILWLNTVLLVLGSIAMQRARRGAERGRADIMRSGLLAGGGFAVAFLIGQSLAWQDLVAAGYYAAANPANAFFYLFTAVHGVHLLGGLAAWGRTTVKLWRGAPADALRMSIGLCAVYWHFLLVVWLVLFGLLLLT